MVGFEVRVNKTSEQKVRRGHGGGGGGLSAEEWNVLACYLIYLIVSLLLELAYY